MEQLVLCGQSTDGYTYWHDWYHCFLGESKKAAQDEYEMLWLQASETTRHFFFHSHSIYISSDEESERFTVVTLQEWFEMQMAK